MTRRQTAFALSALALALLWPGLDQFVEGHAGMHDLLHGTLFVTGLLLGRALPRERAAQQETGAEI